MGGSYTGRDQYLTFYSLKAGSVISDIGITIPSGVKAISVYQTLESELTKGFSLGGFSLAQAVTLSS